MMYHLIYKSEHWTASASVSCLIILYMFKVFRAFLRGEIEGENQIGQRITGL